MSFVCTKHSICIVTIGIPDSAPNSRYVFVPHDMHPARVRFNTIRYDTISSRFRYETICCHVICLHETLDMYGKYIYVYAPNTEYLFALHDMHPARVYETICYHVICLHETPDVYCNDMYLCFLTKHSIRICPVCQCLICIPHEFVSTRYGMIKFHLETICCHVICLHETLDMYFNDMFIYFRTKLSIRVWPAWYASRTSSFQHDTVWSNFISISIRDDMISCHLSARNTRYVLWWNVFMFLPQTLDSYLSFLICIPHEFVSTRNGMIQCHLEFDMRWYAVISFVCTKHSICIVMKCIYVSAPNTQCLFFPHDMHPARVRSDTIRYDTISSQDNMLSCHLSARNTRCAL